MPANWLRTAKWGLLALSIGSLLMAGLFVWRTSSAPGLPQGQGGGGVQTRVERPLIVERKGERLLWRLQAASAEQKLTGNMKMYEPLLELTTEEGALIPIQSREALFDPVARSARFLGDVRADFPPWHLECDELFYESGAERLQVTGSFRLSGDSLHIRGKDLTMLRKEETLAIADGVQIVDRHRNPAIPGIGGTAP